MTPLAQTALDFCHECLGWENATLSMWGPHSNKMIVSKRGRSVVNRLRYTDLNAVMDMVRGWSRSNRISWQATEDGDGLHIKLTDHMGAVFSHRKAKEWLRSDDIGYALLAACVEASRKLKATS